MFAGRPGCDLPRENHQGTGDRFLWAEAKEGYLIRRLCIFMMANGKKTRLKSNR
jgi:hypothetical protein